MILLDTHVLLWATSAPELLSRAAGSAIRKAEKGEGIAIASITLWETALLIDQGRIVVQGSAHSFLDRLCEKAAVVIFDLDFETAALAFQFPPEFPNDPADRIIAATARAHGLRLVTKDERIRGCPLVQTLW